MGKIGPNDPCPCGSGEKYKKCCLAGEAAVAANLDQTGFGRHKLRKTEGELTSLLYDEAGEMESIRFTWRKKGNEMHPEWDNTIMGTIAIDRGRLTVEVNSEKRSQAIQREIKNRLKDKAVYKNAVMSSAKLKPT
ncbi:MAG: SEC-C metal-binding domain-containing protein [Desulfobacterales bacterium]|nr:SEC-C metal-binding domain-containing protein [Desulfobacterales bacterium]